MMQRTHAYLAPLNTPMLATLFALALAFALVAACSDDKPRHAGESKGDAPSERGADPSPAPSKPSPPPSYGFSEDLITSQPVDVLPRVETGERELIERLSATHRQVNFLLLANLDGEIFPCGCSSGQQGGLMRAAGYIEAWNHRLEEEGVEHHALGLGFNLTSPGGLFRDPKEMPYFHKRAQLVSAMLGEIGLSANSFSADGLELRDGEFSADDAPREVREEDQIPPSFQHRAEDAEATLSIWLNDSGEIAALRRYTSFDPQPRKGRVVELKPGEELPPAPRIVLAYDSALSVIERLQKAWPGALFIYAGGGLQDRNHLVVDFTRFLGDKGIAEQFDIRGAREILEVRLWLPKDNAPSVLHPFEIARMHEEELGREQSSASRKASAQRSLDSLITDQSAFAQFRRIPLVDAVRESNRVRFAYHAFVVELERSGLMQEPGDYRKPDAYISGCSTCHSAFVESFREHSPHIHAWDALPESGRADPFCRSCHITYDDPTVHVVPPLGKPMAAPPSRESIQVYEGVLCGHCHLQARPHQTNPEVYKPITIPRADCLTCHNEKQAPNFDVDAAWEKLACIIEQRK